MSQKKELSPDFGKCRELLKELIGFVYGYKQIDCYPKKEDNPAEFEILLRNNDQIAVFQKTDTYRKNFLNILRYTFIPPEGVNVIFKIGKENIKVIDWQEYINKIIECTIQNFVGKDEIKNMIKS